VRLAVIDRVDVAILEDDVGRLCFGLRRWQDEWQDEQR
jgi:hypothetical protein